ncbi:MAG: hypothetical protein HYU86_04765 [Chloroflexi bacterium]|nr:hypothetical protein [Chloroflexota bacterium]
MSADKRRGGGGAHGAGKKNQGQPGPVRYLFWALAGLAIVVLALVLVPRFTGGGEAEQRPQVGTPAAGFQRVGPLEVSATDVDLGKVPLDRWISYTFHLRNASPAPVTVTFPKDGVQTLEGC